jgi:hypothetical protein
MEAIREKVPLDELLEEQREIEQTYLTLRFTQKVRHTTLSCFRQCGGKPLFPFRIEPDSLIGKSHSCFGDCLNVNFEKGPFLNELGEIPEGSIPKKFVWSHGI